MPHVLHLLTHPPDPSALEVIRAQAADPDVRLSIVLAGGAGPIDEPLPGALYRLDPAHPDAPAKRRRTIGASELLDLIFTADSVVTW